MSATLALGALATAALVAGHAWWRGLVPWSRRRGVPPGSLGLRDSLRALRDPDFLLARAARLGPVFALAHFHRPVVVVTDLRLGMAVLARERNALRMPEPPFGARSVAHRIAFRGDPGHPRHRPALERAITPPFPEAQREAIARVVHGRVRGVAASSAGVARAPDEWLPSLALECLAVAFAGIDGEHPRFLVLRRELDTIAVLARRRFVTLDAHLGPVVALLRDLGRELPRDGAGGSALGRLLALGARQGSDEVTLGNLALLLWAERGHVTGVLRWTLRELLDHPGELATLCALAEDGTMAVRARSALVVREVLRLHQSEFFQREATRDVRVGDHRVPRGWLLRVAVREGHLDPAVFAEPRAFRPERFAARAWAPDEYVPVSDGSHSPLGAEVAMAAGASLAEALALACEGQVVSDGPPVRERNRHWSHWRPSRRWRVALAPRATPADPR